jgi:hypothetical protein
MTMQKNLESNSLETEIRIFTDDLETALGQNDDYFLRLHDEREVPEADSLIFDYLFNNVKITGEGWENAKVTYIGKELKVDKTYIYLEYENISEWGEVSITNNILFEHYADQINQISFLYDDQIKELSCYKNYPTKTFNLNP